MWAARFIVQNGPSGPCRTYGFKAARNAISSDGVPGGRLNWHVGRDQRVGGAAQGQRDARQPRRPCRRARKLQQRATTACINAIGVDAVPG